MSQKDLLLPWVTVLENIMLGAKLRREMTADIRHKARQMLNEAGIGEYEKQYPAVLSGGMRQRVALLRTLLEERPIILMDEPFSALDALTRLKLQDLSAQLTRGKTVLLVTHDPMEALRLGDRIAVLGGSPARVIAELTPGGSVPRESGGAIIVDTYPQLLRILMNGEKT
jgi:putative hydroxymethylpyrimidine transport system ATP-binding protein